MRILHIPYVFYPDPVGGTEIYTASLAIEQQAAGWDVEIAAPGAVNARYLHEGLAVSRFAVSLNLTLDEMYGDGDPVAAENFEPILDAFKPDIVHLHSFTSAVSVSLARLVSERGIPLILNFHTPTISCLRGTLLRWGSEICDGKLDSRICSACTLEGRGVSRPIAELVSLLPAGASRFLGKTGFSGALVTALRMPELTGLRVRAFHSLAQHLDRVVALCEWSRTLLIKNGVPADKIVLNRQGIVWSQHDQHKPAEVRSPKAPLRAAFFGRFDPTKGPDVLVRAIREDRSLPIQLDLVGVRQGDAGNQYGRELEALTRGDTRFRMVPAVKSAEVIPALREYDFLIVPSQWMETGPLVVLEAFAAGIPVLGSNLGGIAELVRDGVDGLLVSPANSTEAWLEALRGLCDSPDLLSSLKAGILPPRHSRQAASDMITTYEELISVPSHPRARLAGLQAS